MALNDGPAGWWPVDTVFVVYLAGIGGLIAFNFSRVPDAGWLLAAHAAGLALVFAAGRFAMGHRLSTVFHHWYPLIYIPLCYREMAVLIPAVRGVDFDAEMARVDRWIWGVDPTVWLGRWQTPWLTEYLQIAYTLFIPSVVLVAAWLWIGFSPGRSPAAARKRRPTRADFRYYAFVVSLGFLASYIGYLVVPVRGPRFYMAGLHTAPLEGLWTFGALRAALDRLESAHFDCFPSGHTALTLIACWTSRLVSPGVFAGFCLYTASIVFATVYLRYHYTVDVVAGAALAAIVLVAAPRLYAAGQSRRRKETG